jgi:hypothetical protein
MLWFDGEPTLDELLSDPVIVALMERDGIAASDLRELLAAMEKARQNRRTPRSETPTAILDATKRGARRPDCALPC